MVVKTGAMEIRWHGRGGQGAVTSAELIAQAAINEGKYAQAFPSFGPERRGAPVLVFNRVSDDEPIRIRAGITQPDVVVVLDPGLLTISNVTSGLKADGIVIINTKKSIDEVRNLLAFKGKLATLDATTIARELLGVPIVNTTMIGALIRVTDIVKLESMPPLLERRFARLAERNFKAMQKAYQEIVIGE